MPQFQGLLVNGGRIQLRVRKFMIVGVSLGSALLVLAIIGGIFG